MKKERMKYELRSGDCIGLFTSSVEAWKDVEGFEGAYQISSFGNVRSCPRYRPSKGSSVAWLKGRILKPKSSNYGYLVVTLQQDNKREHPSLHRLVAAAFLPNPFGKPTVNHRDGNKENNNISNLEWATSSEQIVHAFETGLILARGEPKFSKDFKRQVYEYYHTHEVSIAALAKLFDISQRTAGRVVKGVVPRTTTRVKKDGTRVVEDILTQDQVTKIKKLRAEGWTFAMLAAEFNRGLSQMHRVVNGKSRNTTIE